MGGVKLTPPVNEQISSITKRTAAIGEKIIAAQRGIAAAESISIQLQQPITQPGVRFTLPELMQYWNPDWELERAGFGGDGVGAMPGIRGQTALDDDTLITYPRDEARGLVLRRALKLGIRPSLEFQVAADPGKAWELNVYAGNRQVLKKIIDGGDKGLGWQTIIVDLEDYAEKETTLRLYQRVLMPNTLKVPGKAYWKTIVVK